ncbi:hypothetical protein EON66_05810 [archaeon]|nr:MAG: hypothetical protein EON66_05810 [archaeon]
MLCHSISKKTVDVSAFHIDSEGMYSSDLTMWAELLNALKCVRFKTTAAPSAGIASRPELVTYAAFPAEALAEAATSPVSGRPTLAGRPTLSAAHRPMPALATTPMTSSSYATATRDATVMKTGLASPTMMAAGAGGAAATPVAQVRNPDAVRPEPKSVLGMLGAMAKDAASSLFSTDNARLTDIETLSTQWDIQRKSYVDEVNRLAKDNARLVEVRTHPPPPCTHTHSCTRACPCTLECTPHVHFHADAHARVLAACATLGARAGAAQDGAEPRGSDARKGDGGDHALAEGAGGEGGQL